MAAKDTYPSRIFACCAIFGVVWSLRGSAFGSKVVAVCVGMCRCVGAACSMILPMTKTYV